MRKLAFILVLFIGCTPLKEVIIQHDTLYVPINFTDTLTLTRIDTVFGGQSERVLLRVDTLWKRAWVKVVDTITVPVPPDTVRLAPVELPPTLWNSVKYWLPFSALGLLLGVGVCLYLIRKFK